MIKELSEIIEDIREKKYWYFSNHSKDFVKMCYVVDLLSRMSANTTQAQMELIRDEFNRNHPEIKIETAMFKSMIVSKIYGLLDNSNRTYVKCNPTPVFNTIKERTNGKYINKDIYMDIIEQQIEKLFFITPLISTKGKEDFQLYPLFFLYKILLEIGKITREFKISVFEFDYFVATSKSYEEWDKIVKTILHYRKNNLTEESIIKLLKKNSISTPDQRYNQIIDILPYFKITNTSISLRTDYISKVKDKIITFEIVKKIPDKSPGALPNGFVDSKNYFKFLTNNCPLLPTL